jgi:hypothetical protein
VVYYWYDQTVEFTGKIKVPGTDWKHYHFLEKSYPVFSISVIYL